MRSTRRETFAVSLLLSRYTLEIWWTNKKRFPLKNACFYVSSWWLNQPIWKICSSNWESFPQVGVNIKNDWNHHLGIYVQYHRCLRLYIQIFSRKDCLAIKRASSVLGKTVCLVNVSLGSVKSNKRGSSTGHWYIMAGQPTTPERRPCWRQITANMGFP